MRVRLIIAALVPLLTACTMQTEPPGTPVSGVATAAGTTLRHLVHIWTIPEYVEGQTTAAGFDIDGQDHGGGIAGGDCSEASEDHIADADPRHRGVDNLLQHLVPYAESELAWQRGISGPCTGCLDATLASTLAEGRALVLIELSDVQSLLDDDDVLVTLFEVALDSPRLEDGRLAPGQRVRIVRQLADPIAGHIADGRVHARASALQLPSIPELAAARWMWPTQVQDAELRFDVHAEGLSRGRLGGAATTDHLETIWNEISPGIEPGRITTQLADLDPMPEDPGQCTRVSFGFAFEAVPVILRGEADE